MGKNTTIPLLLISLIHLQICLVSSQTTSTTDEMTLLSLQATLNSTTLSTNWSRATPFCTWTGVNCSSVGSRVTGLDLSNMGLTGSIPATIGNLSSLTVLNMRNNSIGGAIPSEIGNVRQLRELDVSNNRLTDRVPESVGLLTGLRSLNVSYNRLRSCLKLPISLGIAPWMLLFLMFKTVRNERLPIVAGMDPVRPMFERSRPVTRDPTRPQLTPIHVQYWDARDQFVDSVVEFRFAWRDRRVISSMVDVF